MGAWLRKKAVAEENPDDVPTGQIAAVSIAAIIAEADGGTSPSEGTETVEAASKTDVESTTTGPADLEQALADRQALIQLCLYALDRARSGGVVERLEHGLAGIGVRALRPDGERFDPAVHEAGGAVATEDPALEGLVAETEVVGFADHDRVLRVPIVIVYAKKAQ
ncbi:nucleotide exchange factor GrpE [Amycolatopsis sp. BJA-103]|uniref:nucleotide exchange factor GrpE n=1 Tax=unclassified Amycolatopsis TaxID=2618356 RepID=UPI000C78D001|nr:nucleotide exchange factor GrpE [Amycolatopsis sp. BJA-103]AUI62570.1 nucleotide exchange factor GrpE [Amycolatopsis sp. BJA-103]PNE18408.1 nucleotide exchange factor GrpE [Amycolatopsis sp. BJA-103]